MTCEFATRGSDECDAVVSDWVVAVVGMGWVRLCLGVPSGLVDGRVVL